MNRKRHRSSSKFVALGLFALCWTSGPAAAADGPETIAGLERDLARHHPALEAAWAEVNALQQRARSVASFDDPRLTYGYFVNPVQTRLGPQEHQIGVAQTLPWWGTRDHRRRIFEIAATAAYATMQDTWLELRVRLHRALHAWVRSEEALTIEGESLALLEQFESVARTRLRVGRSDSLDLTRLQIEIARQEDRIAQLERRRQPLRAEIEALVGRPFRDSTVPALPESFEALAPTDSLVARLGDHPRVQALRLAAQREEAQTRVARDAGLPALTLGVTHTFVGTSPDFQVTDEGHDATMAMISLQLPLGRGRIDASVRAAQENRSAVRARARAVLDDLDVELATALFDFEDADRRVDLYSGTLIEKATQTLRTLLGRYSVSEAEYGDLIDAQRILLEFRLGELDARVARADAWSRIEQWVRFEPALNDLDHLRTLPAPQAPEHTEEQSSWTEEWK